MREDCVFEKSVSVCGVASVYDDGRSVCVAYDRVEDIDRNCVAGCNDRRACVQYRAQLRERPKGVPITMVLLKCSVQ